MEEECTLETILPDHIKYWLREAPHDCSFVFGPEPDYTNRIGAMKIFLMGHSEPFRKMLNDSDLAEKGNKPIPIEDVFPEAFLNFLICVYGGSDYLLARLDFEDCARLLYIADKYMADYIKGKVSSRLQELFSYDKIFLALSHPICYDGSLKKEVLKCLEDNFEKIKLDEKFQDLNCAVLKWILEQETLNVKEIEIWNSILRWTKHQTNSTDGEVLREHIFPLLNNIRFLAMDCQEFCNHVAVSNVLHDNEVYEICKSFGSGNPHNLDHICKKRDNRFNPQIQRGSRLNPRYVTVTRRGIW